MFKIRYLFIQLTMAFLAYFIPLHLYSDKMLPELEFSVEVKDESCSSDGQLTFLVTPTDPAASITYHIFIKPELTLPFKIHTEPILGNLSAGEYRIIAIQELDGERQSKQVDVTINNSYEQTEFQIITEDICQGNDGKIIVKINGGTANSFQIQGPVNVGPQTENEFEGLPGGNYTVRLTNECGERYSQSITLQQTSITLDESLIDFNPELPSCGEISIGHYISSTGSGIQYPITIDFRVHLPEGGTEEYQSIVDSGPLVEGLVYGNVPFFNGVRYSYDVQIIDACGNTVRSYDNPIDRRFEISRDLRFGAGNCGKRILSISPLNYTAPYDINFISYPEGFNPSINEQFPGPYSDETILFGTPEFPMPDGTYLFEVIDACGNSTGQLRMDHLTSTFKPGQTLYHGCSSDKGSLLLATNDYNMTQVEIVNAPPAYTPTLPQDVTQHVYAHEGRKFSMNNLPEGHYEFKVENDCGSSHTIEVEIQGHKVNLDEVEVSRGCGSFDLLVNHESNLNSSQGIKFGLQKYDSLSQTWGHPVTGGVYSEGDDLNNDNAAFIYHNKPNFNLPYTGKLRVVKTSRYWKNGAEIEEGGDERSFCLMVLEEFEIYNSLNLSEVSFFSCSGDLFDAVVTATGTPDLNFKIISKDGNPFLLDNGNNPVFSDLEKGHYEFQIEDACSNILNKSLNIYKHTPRIVPSNLCFGQSGELMVEGFNFLQFEWWKESAPSSILSENHNLSFESFDTKVDQGIYWVKLTDTDPESCLNGLLSFEIPSEDSGPNGGSDLTAEICEGEIVDLFSLLEEPFDKHGLWEEIGESNALNNNLWNTTGLASGIYEFTYTVQGICNGEAQIKLSLNLHPIPLPPMGEPLQTFCASEAPRVADLIVDGENISWYLQAEGGVALTPNTALQDNTPYYAAQTVNGCISQERLVSEVIIEEDVQNNIILENQSLPRNEVPSLLIGSVPTGANGLFTYQWQESSDELTWENIPGADQKDYQPEILRENEFYRRIVGSKCYENISNIVVLSVITVDLTITKTSFNKEIHDGENFIYEIIVENIGLFTATEVNITDILPPNVNLVSSDHFPSSKSMEIIPLHSENVIRWEIRGFEAGESISIQMEVTPYKEGPLVNTAEVGSKEEDVNLENNFSEDQNIVLPIFIPNVIKPDFDGKNDYFVIRALNKFETVRLVIFNRWGDHVYESKNYQNDWSAERLNAGTYYYVINGTDKFNMEHVYKGWVQVIKN